MELFTGIPVQNQQLLLLNNETDDQPIATLADNSRPLGFYSAHDWQVLKVRAFQISHPTPDLIETQVVDTNPSTSFTGQFSDTSQVEKFELSEEAYAQRQGALVIP